VRGRLLAAAAVLALAAPAGAAGAAPPREPKAIVLGIDGATADVLEGLDLPTLEGLAARGLYARTTLYVPPRFLTVSGVGWGTMATGTWPDKHGIETNLWPENRLERYPSVLERLERTVPGVRTAGMAVWAPMVDPATPGGPILGPSLDVRETASDDTALGERAGRWIRSADVDAAFLQFDDVDAVGHAAGSDSAAYRDQLAVTDRALGQVLDGIRARPTFDREDWLVVVSADHGQNPEGGHGGPQQRERTTFVIAAGGRVDRAGGGLVPGGAVTLPERKLVDVAPSVLDHLGVTPEPAWGLDGRPFWAADDDPFDALGAGPTVRAPAGWTSRGWEFGTDPWWTQARNVNPVGDEIPNATNNPIHPKEIELDERENFLAGRGLRAIADAAHAGGTLDAELVSAPYDVTGARRATVRFAEAYRGTDRQDAVVVVRYDDGPERVVLRHGPVADPALDVSGLTQYLFQEAKAVGFDPPLAQDLLAAAGQASSKVDEQHAALDVAVPPGARTLRVAWRLRARGRGWFWTIDEPSVTTDAPAPDRVAPVVRGLRVLLRRGVSFDLSEDARVVVRVSRGGRTVVRLVRRGRLGRNLVRLPRRAVRGGRLRLSVGATDAAGNRARPVAVALRARARRPVPASAPNRPR
jgi:hypothetical protein